MTTQDLKDQLLAVERGLWTNDAELYHESLVPEAMLVVPESGVISRDFAVEAIRKENAEGRKWVDVRFGNVRAQPISADTAALTYTVSARWNCESKETVWIASSVYVKRENAWKLAVHQQGQLPGR
ncbi:MAG TPA: nuclear transport factor 2 family protein [Hyphomonadaceae bacterium]|nr:nuclear transport factor 2 family protein [Hyphomonadaceae bacterium]